MYAVSNLGSLLALLSYPGIPKIDNSGFEQWFTLHQQASIWSIAFGIFVLLCGFTAFRSGAEVAVAAEAAAEAEEQLAVEKPGFGLGQRQAVADRHLRK